jgi:hypothetical protein
MSKEVLIGRLVTAERTVAEQRERWLVQQDEMLTWQLRAETAEMQLQNLNWKRPVDWKKLRKQDSCSLPNIWNGSLLISMRVLPPWMRQHDRAGYFPL